MAEICPFSGQTCPHPKITHAAEVSDTGIIQLSMCKICTGQYLKATSHASLPIDHLAVDMINFIEKITEKKPAPVGPTCVCGTTINEIIKTGKIGCDHCFVTFRNELRKILLRYHGNNQHQNKIPKSWQQRQEDQKEKAELALSTAEQIKILQIKMAKAIEVENYEIAGVLKEKIHALQQNLS